MPLSPDQRISELAKTALKTSADDYLAIDGQTNGTQKLGAFSPWFGGNVIADGSLLFGTSLSASSGRVQIPVSTDPGQGISFNGMELQFYRRSTGSLALSSSASTSGGGLDITSAGAGGRLWVTSAGTPRVLISDSTGGADQKTFGIESDPTHLFLKAYSDDLTSDATFLTLNRGSGYSVSSISVGANFSVAGMVASTGSISISGAGNSYQGGAWISNVASTGISLFGTSSSGFYAKTGGSLQLVSSVSNGTPVDTLLLSQGNASLVGNLSIGGTMSLTGQATLSGGFQITDGTNQLNAGISSGVPYLQGTGTSSRLAFYTASERMRLMQGLNVGGTTDPGVGAIALSGSQTATNTSTGTLIVGSNVGMSGSTGGDIFFGGPIRANGPAGGSSTVVQFLNNGTAVGLIGSGAVIGGTAGDLVLAGQNSAPIKFYPSSTLALTLTPTASTFTGTITAAGVIQANDNGAAPVVRAFSSATYDAVFSSYLSGVREWTFGGKRSDAGFHISSSGGVLGTNDVLSITPAGAVTVTGGMTLSGAAGLTLSAGSIGLPNANGVYINDSTGVAKQALLLTSGNVLNIGATTPGNTVVYGGTATSATFSSTGVTVAGNLTGGGYFEQATSVAFPGAVTDRARHYYNSAAGLAMYGAGSINDVTIYNKAGNSAIEVPTGTQNVNVIGNLTVKGGTTTVSSTTDASLSISSSDTSSRAAYTAWARSTTGAASSWWAGTGHSAVGADWALRDNTAGTVPLRVSQTSGNVALLGNLTVNGTGTSSFAGNVSIGTSATDRTLSLISATGSNRLIDFREGADTNARLVARADGRLFWGDGAGTFDAYIERGGAAQLTVGASIGHPYQNAGTAGTPAYDAVLIDTQKSAGLYFGNQFANNYSCWPVLRYSDTAGALHDGFALSSTGNGTLAGTLTVSGGVVGSSLLVIQSTGTNNGVYLRPNGTGKVIIDTGTGGLDVQVGNISTVGNLTVTGTGFFGGNSSSVSAVGVVKVASSNGAGGFRTWQMGTDQTSFDYVIKDIEGGTSPFEIAYGSGATTIRSTQASTSTTNGALSIGSNVGLSGNAGGTSYFGGPVSVSGKISNGATFSLAGDVSTSVVNLSATGYGLRVQGGASGSGYIFSANDYTGSEKFNIAGNGKVTLTPTAYSQAVWNGTGALAHFAPGTVTDSSTAASGTAASEVFYSFWRPTLAATNTGVTTTDAATIYVQGGPQAGTNQTITNSWGIWNAGNARIDGTTLIGSTLTVNGEFHLQTSGTDRAKLRSDASGNLVMSGTGSGAAYIAFDSGTGGTHFGDGAGHEVGYITSAGVMSLSGTGTHALAGPLQINGTNAIKGVRTLTTSLDFGSVAAGGHYDLSVTVTGAAVGDTVEVNESDGNWLPDGIRIRAQVTATNTVTVRAINTTAGAIDPSAQNFRITVISF